MGVVVGTGVEVGGNVLLGSGFLGAGTGIGRGDSLGLGVGVAVGVGSGFGVEMGIGIGDGVPMGVVKPGEVILWAMPVPEGCANASGAATDRKLIEIVAIRGTKNKIESVKIRVETKLNFGIW